MQLEKQSSEALKLLFQSTQYASDKNTQFYGTGIFPKDIYTEVEFGGQTWSKCSKLYNFTCISL